MFVCLFHFFYCGRQKRMYVSCNFPWFNGCGRSFRYFILIRVCKKMCVRPAPSSIPYNKQATTNRKQNKNENNNCGTSATARVEWKMDKCEWERKKKKQKFLMKNYTYHVRCTRPRTQCDDPTIISIIFDGIALPFYRWQCVRKSSWMNLKRLENSQRQPKIALKMYEEGETERWRWRESVHCSIVSTTTILCFPTFLPYNFIFMKTCHHIWCTMNTVNMEQKRTYAFQNWSECLAVILVVCTEMANVCMCSRKKPRILGVHPVRVCVCVCLSSPCKYHAVVTFSIFSFRHRFEWSYCAREPHNNAFD